MINLEQIASDLIRELEGQSLICKAEAEGVRKFYARIAQAGEEAAAAVAAEKKDVQSGTEEKENSQPS